jgi:protein phosphatase PTC2/3
MLLGPHRVLPGRLSVSRTFGDIEAKLTKYGGKEGVIIAQPEIS